MNLAVARAAVQPVSNKTTVVALAAVNNVKCMTQFVHLAV